MTQYVCQSDTPLAQGQTCVSWVEYQPLFPSITTAQANEISVAIFLVCASAWGFRKLADFLQSF